MTLALNLHITESNKLHVVIYDIDDEFGAASVRDIFEVNDTSQKNKTTLRMMIKTRATECMHVMVEEGVKGAVRVGNHYCIPVRSRGNLWKKAWEHVSDEAELMQRAAAPKPAPEEELQKMAFVLFCALSGSQSVHLSEASAKTAAKDLVDEGEPAFQEEADRGIGLWITITDPDGNLVGMIEELPLYK